MNWCQFLLGGLIAMALLMAYHGHLEKKTTTFQQERAIGVGTGPNYYWPATTYVNNYSTQDTRLKPMMMPMYMGYPGMPMVMSGGLAGVQPLV
jgi:hypothetical protein